MNQIIIYGSCYGTSQHYAKVLSQKTQIKAVSYDQIKDLDGYNRIIYIGGLYAGGVKGLKQVLPLIKTSLILATVGLADVKDHENIENICMSLQRQIPADLYQKTTLFHLRGGINYQILNVKHKTMMALLYQKAKRIPKEQQTADVKAMIETYHQKVDFYDESSLDPIIQMIKEG